MRDTNLIFNDGSTATAGTGGGVVTASAYSPVVGLCKSGLGGFWVELVCAGITGTQGTLDAKLQYCDTTNGTFIDGPDFTQLTTSTGRQARLCQTNLRYARMSYTTGGTSPNYTVHAHVASSPNRDDS